MFGILPAWKKIFVQRLRCILESRDLGFMFVLCLFLQRILALGEFNAHRRRTLAGFRNTDLRVRAQAGISALSRYWTDVSQNPFAVALCTGGVQGEAGNISMGNRRIVWFDVSGFGVSDGCHCAYLDWYAIQYAMKHWILFDWFECGWTKNI